MSRRPSPQPSFPPRQDASRLITGEGGGTDASHMNAAYGQAVWAAVGRVLSA